MNDDNEIIELACVKCDGKVRGTYAKLFGDIPSLVVLPKFTCKCGGEITLSLTGEYE